MAAGATVIVDAVHSRPEERLAIEDVAAGTGAAFAGFWLEAPKDVLRNRVAQRGRDVSDATVDVVERQHRRVIGEMSWPRIDVRGESTAIATRLHELAVRRRPAVSP